MARIELNIVAVGDFKSVNSQIAALKAQVDALNKSVVGVGLSSNLNKQLLEANAAFKSTMLSTGQFTAQTVKLKSETDKFGQSLVGGKLKLTEYFNIIRSGTTNATAQMRALALEQTKLQNSIVMTDPTKQGVLSVYTPTRINEVANATKIASNMQNLYNIAVNKGTQSLINWGKNTQWAGRQLTVGMTVPLTIFGSTAVNVFRQVNDEIVRLQKVYGTGLTQPTQAVLDQIKVQVLGLSKELASTMGIAVKDTAAMAADLAATGKQGNDLIVATREAMRLQKLGEMDTQSAMQTTISLQNVYKLSTNQLSGAVNFLNAVENQTSTSLQDLAAGIPKVGPIVQQLGGSFKDTAIMMVAMKEAGVPAAQSANAIKSALASLINPTKAAKDAFAAYNINLGAIATTTKGNPVQMIMMLQQALKGLQPLAQAQLIEKLFGKFQEARIQALITNLGAVNSQTKTAFDLMNASDAQLSGIAAGEIKTATESVTGKFKRAVETMKADLLPVGEKIMSIATTLLNFGNSIAKVFSGLPGPVKTVMGIVAAGVALSGPIIMFTGVLANFVGYLMKGLFALVSLKNGTKTFGELFTPEIIASQNAAELFSNKILEDESAVMLLNKAVQELTISLEGMSAAMAASTSSRFASSVAAVEAGLAGGKIPFKAPGMATGGYVPGNPSQGDVYPAMLTGGEAVIPAGPAAKYAPFINAMITGKLPGYKKGTPVNGESTWINPGRYSAPSDSPFAGAGKEILSMNGDLEKGQSILQEIVKQYGLTKKSLVDQLMGADIAHINKEKQIDPTTGKEEKTWRKSNLAASFSVENKMLEYGTRKGKVGDAFRESADNADKALSEELKKKYSKEEISKAISSVKMGNQPVTELESAIYHNILQDLKSKVSSGKLGKSPTTTRWLDSAAAITAQRQSGGFLTPAAELTLAKEINIASDSHSASRVTKKAAKNIVDGVVVGLKEGEQKVKYTAESLMGPSMQNGSYYKNETEAQPGWFNRARSRLTNANGKMPLGLKMGGSMAMMMGGQALSGMIPKGSIASSLVGSATTMGGMGMMFGPWGAAAGAAIGLVTSGIGALMKAEKQHQLQVQSTFKASADAVNMFGGTLTDQSMHMHTFFKEVSQSKQTVDQLQKSVDAISKLDPKPSGLRIVADSLKGMGTANSVIGTLKQFAAAQVANGMDPSKVSDMVNAMLSYAGKSQYAASALKEISASTKDVSSATTTWISKLKDASTEISAYQFGYGDLNTKQKAFADGLLNVYNQILNTNTSFVTAISLANGLSSGITNAADAYKALQFAAQNAGDTQLSTLLQRFQAQGVDPGQGALISKVIQEKGFAPGMLNSKAQKEYYAKQGAAMLTAHNNLLKQQESLKNTQQIQEKAVLTNQQLLAIAEKKLKAEQDAANAIKAQNDFMISQTDLQNQMRVARAKGDFLQAGLLQQQIYGKQKDYVDQNTVTPAQAEVDRLKELTSKNQSSLSSTSMSLAKVQISISTSIDKSLNDGDLKKKIEELTAAIEKAFKIEDNAVNVQPTNSNYTIGTPYQGMGTVSLSELKKQGIKEKTTYEGSGGLPQGTYNGVTFMGKDGKKYKIGAPVRNNPNLYTVSSYAIGTPYVPHDMIAQIHKGERIIPASQNNGTMGSTFNVTLNIARADSSIDIENAVKDAFTKVTQKAGMTNTNWNVRV